MYLINSLKLNFKSAKKPIKRDTNERDPKYTFERRDKGALRKDIGIIASETTLNVTSGVARRHGRFIQVAMRRFSPEPLNRIVNLSDEALDSFVAIVFDEQDIRRFAIALANVEISGNL